MSPPDPAEPESPDPGVPRRDRREYYRRWYCGRKVTDPAGLWRGIVLRRCRGRARKQGIPFCLTKSDLVLPEVCPVLGIAVRHADGRADDFSPSVDRLVPELGYVPGNIAVISNRANTIKSFGTAEEHRRIANWMDRMAAKSGGREVPVTPCS